MRSLRWALRFTAVAAFAAFGAGRAAAQQGSIAGTVTDKASGQPLSGVRVVVAGLAIQTQTNSSGKYTLSGVPAGAHDIRATFVGYESGKRPLTVAAGETVTADFALTAVPYTLDEVVSTATGDQRRIELGHTIGKIQADSLISAAPIRNVTDVLQGRVAGVTALQSSGTTGTGAQIRIRGVSSISLTNEPLLFIDGVRMDNGPASSAIGVGGQSPSRLNDLNPDEIEDIQIVKGPSASTLYGPEAGNGVILVTTKKGRAGKAKWNVYAEQGVVKDTKRYPTNYAVYGKTVATGTTPAAATRSCYVFRAAQGLCTIDSTTSYSVLYNPITSPISDGSRSQFGSNVSGGNDLIRYFFSGEYERERGTLNMPQAEQQRITALRGYANGVPDEISHPNFYAKYSFRSNVTAQVAKNAEVTASVGYISSNLRLPQNDNNTLGIIPSGLFGSGSVGDTAGTGNGWGFFRPGETMSIITRQNIERMTSNLTGNWRPFSFLALRGVFGYDINQRLDEVYCATNTCPAFGTQLQGYKEQDQTRIRQYTALYDATANYGIRTGLKGKTTAGVQYFRNNFSFTSARGENLVPGSTTITGAGRQFASESDIYTVTVGAYVEQQFALNDRLFLTGAARIDKASAIGQNFTPKLVPKANASYVISDESWFPRPDWLNTLRLRAAFGKASVLPTGALVNAAIQNYSFTTTSIGGTDVPSLTLNNAGNPSLKPEISTEYEGGFDATLFKDRVTIEFTGYQKTTKDALISRILAPSLGVTTSQLFNLGSTRNQGLELALTVRPVQSKAVTWDFTITGSLLRNRVLSLGFDPQGNPIPPILNASGIQRVVAGTPINGYWDRPILSYSDANKDGKISPSEVVVGDTAQLLGNYLPSREAAFNTSVGLLDGHLRVNAQVDYRGGYKLYNLTESYRCQTFKMCQGVNDPNASLAQQAAAAAANTAAYGNTQAGYIEDASFLRFRELGVSYIAGKSFAKKFGASTATLTFAVRNLAIITNYTGADPEVNQLGQGSQNLARDFLTQPPVRTFIARASFGF